MPNGRPDKARVKMIALAFEYGTAAAAGASDGQGGTSTDCSTGHAPTAPRPAMEPTVKINEVTLVTHG